MVILMPSVIRGSAFIVGANDKVTATEAAEGEGWWKDEGFSKLQPSWHIVSHKLHYDKLRCNYTF
jgi:hypothetical protein